MSYTLSEFLKTMMYSYSSLLISIGRHIGSIQFQVVCVESVKKVSHCHTTEVQREDRRKTEIFISNKCHSNTLSGLSIIISEPLGKYVRFLCV